ncbi:MAG: glycosyl hydrolase 2 galactose-binding domain-containing protein, partial [Candidatus Cryptobacteroides sp.]
RFSHLKIEFDMPGAAYWTIHEVKFHNGDEAVTDILPSSEFHSAWMSAGDSQEWVYVDLGTPLSFDKVRLHWLEKPLEGEIQVSDDAVLWESVAALPRKRGLTDEIRCDAAGRYVRVLMTRADKGGRYALSEMEVWGRGGLSARPKDVKGWQDGKYMLDGGSWKVQRASEVAAEGGIVSSAGFDDSSWTAATVPGTVLTSYVNTGAVPDPDYADNMFHISESFFNSDFWYRTTFLWEPSSAPRRVFLNFDGINWKADIFLNGKKAGRIEGAFKRGRFDITDLVRDGSNVLAVRIVKNAHPAAVKEKDEMNTDFNGGLLGADNPTFHATVGWDWISTIRGRDIGIWNNVFLSAEDLVTLRDPLVSTVLSGQDATVTPTVRMENNSRQDISGILRGWIGGILFEKEVTLPAGKISQESFLPEEFAQLRDCGLDLWWPNGYGKPCLHDAGFEFVTSGRQMAQVSYKAGIREVRYSGIDTALQLFVNGKRIVPLGGNWGFSESNLNYRSREYDIAVRYHKEMNFNMIRNWVGQTGDEEFYEACDRHGIMVWQDFWLANPADGPDPYDEEMFLDNAFDYVSRIRRHPSVVLYCGRNEGFPPKSIDTALRGYVGDLHPGLPYISSSADNGVSGHGPYCTHPVEYYFSHQTGKLHTERGMPNVVSAESLRRMLSPDALWPMGDAWGKHDFTRQGAQKADTFNGLLFRKFGEPSSAEEYTALAQWINYDGYRAMYEADNVHRQGLLIWMSHSCWPSLTWQTYDYYFEPTAAFFACRKACERVHIQYNAATENLEAVNIGGDTLEGAGAAYEVLDLHGKVLRQSSYGIDCPSDTTVICGKVTVPEDHNGAYFLRLTLSDRNGDTVSENLYVLPDDNGSLEELRELPSVTPEVESSIDGTSARITLKNTSDTPALMLRLNLKGSDGGQILPVSYSDNYFHLLPGESRTVSVSWTAEDTRGAEAVIEVSGFNL